MGAARPTPSREAKRLIEKAFLKVDNTARNINEI
jgi:hypothetical protein